MGMANTIVKGSAGMDSSTDSATKTGFNERLDLAVQESGSMVCVGLDPRPDRTPGSYADFCRRIIDETWRHAVAFKPNIAYFEARGGEGLTELGTLMQHLPDGRLMVVDAKRGDIGFTAEAYAQALFGRLGADAITANAYLGQDSMSPFLADPSRGAFILCHTSNPGAGDFQHLDVGGHPLYIEVARRASEWNENNNVGLVVGATYPEELERVRDAAPRLPFLVPGIGAQGGDLEASVRAGRNADGRGLLISSSRGIIYAGDPGEASARLNDAINAARAKG
jgi:orotidine 5'-phosphate decarboxylase subfamily 2